MQHVRTVEAGGAIADVLAELARHRRLATRELRAGHLFLADLAAEHGRTGGLVTPVMERVDQSHTPKSGVTGWTRAHERCQRALDRLHAHERRILEWMICQRERARPDFAALGRQVSTYEDRAQAIAAGVSAIAGLLRSIAEIYLPEEERTKAA